jgi:formylglycine-generating enzyme required for sulfatase activity
MLRQLRQLTPELVPIPSGTFLLGATCAQVSALATQAGFALEWCLDETPQHQVALDAFEIGRGPVTCAEYMAFVLATDHPIPPYWGGDAPPARLRDHPVVEVSYDDARWYCRWLSSATGQQFRLPSEAEWERAARGDDQRSFPWGDAWQPGCCNIAEGGPGTTTPVGSFAQDTSPFGCVDMAGNVEEWTISTYAPYPGSELAPPDLPQIVARGGSWNGDAILARCTRRHARSAALSSPARGFRVVCYPSQG